MLHELQLENFKCFDSLALPLGSLTLLTGANSGGKSSVIQSLVLLSQTFKHQESGSNLMIEGPMLALGAVADVVNQNASQRRLSIGVATAEQRIVWTFQVRDRQALTLDIEKLHINDKPVPIEDPMRFLMPPKVAETSLVVSALRRLSWISAERMGPRELSPLMASGGHQQVGRRGEMAPGLVYWRGDDVVEAALCLPDTPATLLKQTLGYMQQFFPGSDFRVSPVEGVSAISLRMRSDTRSEFQRPQNLGFGLTQLFPIIVAVLAAKKGEVLIVENPEVHLHPRAQQNIGMLLAQAAASGVQVILETHSDHVLNGIRLAVKGKKLAATDVRVHFFERAENLSAQPISPCIDEDGRFDQWPAGFFDQFDGALSELL